MEKRFRSKRMGRGLTRRMTDRTKRSNFARYAIAILAALVGLFVVLKREFDIDRCLDRGSRWDYQNDRCEM